MKGIFKRIKTTSAIIFGISLLINGIVEFDGRGFLLLLAGSIIILMQLELNRGVKE